MFFPVECHQNYARCEFDTMPVGNRVYSLSKSDPPKTYPLPLLLFTPATAIEVNGM